MLVTLEGYNENTAGYSFKKKLKKTVKKAKPIAKMAVIPPTSKEGFLKVAKTAALFTPEGQTAYILKNRKKILNAVKKSSPKVAKKITDKINQIAAFIPSPEVKTALEVTAAEVKNAGDSVEIKSFFLNEADRLAYLAKLEELRKQIKGIVPASIKTSFITPTGTANYIYNLDKPLDGFSLKKVKKVIKTAKAIRKAAKPITSVGHKIMNNPAVQAAAMSNPYTAAGMTAYKAYRKVKETYGDQISATIKNSKDAINKNPKTKKAIIDKAAAKSDITVPPEGVTDDFIATLPPEKKKEFAENLQAEQAAVIVEATAKKTENDSASKMDEIIKKDAERQADINDRGKTFTEPDSGDKWTPEQIKAFNESQERGGAESIEESLTVAEQIKKRNDSKGDLYYKRGTLHGTDELIDELAAYILSQASYQSVTFDSIDFIKRVISAYVKAVQILNQKTGKTNYYNGTTEAERKQFYGNVYIKITYLYMKGYTDEKSYLESKEKLDYVMRDQIWVILSLIREQALKDKKYIPVWKAEIDTAEIQTGGVNIGIIAAAGIAALLLLKKGK